VVKNLKELKIGIYTGNAIRHKYFVDILNQVFKVKFIIIHKPDKYYCSDLIEWNHFWRLEVAENKYMGNYKDVKCNKIYESGSTKNSIEQKYNAVKDINVDYLLIFGCPILDENWCRDFKIINLHLGKSPRYRGASTFFWTYWNKEEYEHLASTILIATPEVDAGPILQYILPDKVTKDYYKTTNKLIKKSIDKFPLEVLRHDDGYLREKPQDITKRKYYYRNLDFNVHKLLDVLIENEISCF